DRAIRAQRPPGRARRAAPRHPREAGHGPARGPRARGGLRPDRGHVRDRPGPGGHGHGGGIAAGIAPSRDRAGLGAPRPAPASRRGVAEGAAPAAAHGRAARGHHRRGAVVLDEVLDALKAREIVLCEWALREGLLLDYLNRHQRSVARAEAYPDVRRRSVVALAERSHYHEAHARQVAALALGLFDAPASRHRRQAPERSLLEFAALLHDIGRHISYPDRHRHTEYLVRHGGLRGFDPREVEIMALVGRYHRRGLPRKKNAAFA